MEHASTLDATETTPPQAPRLGAAIGAIAVYFLVQLGTGLVIAVAMYLVRLTMLSPAHMKAAPHSPHPDLMLVLVAMPISCLLSILIFRRWFARTWKLGGRVGLGLVKIPVSRFGLHLLLGVATTVVGALITGLLARGHPVSQDVIQWVHQASLPMAAGIALMAITVVPVAEEILFRGILLPALLRHMSVAWAITFDAVIFASAHLPDLHWNPVGLAALALMGAVCCWRRLKTGSLYASMAVHAGGNLLVLVALLSMHKH
jgi:membrane protease YdiL (CAAX protease family)